MLDPALLALIQVIVIDIVLAGDNAIVIGMAAACVPKQHRRKVIFWGLAAAVLLRIALAMVTATLLAVIGLTVAGGILLLWVAWRLYRDLSRHKQACPDPCGATENAGGNASILTTDGGSTRNAIIRIAAADLSMSLDNVLAVAGAAMHHVWVLAVGLLLSIALMGVAASLLAEVLNRYRWIGYIGLLIVVYVAGSMIWQGSHQVINAM